MSNAGEIRWKQRLGSFGAALSRLTHACGRSRYDDLQRAGLIKTFEFTFELSWKVLKDLLFYEGFDVRAPRTAIRKGFEAGYIDESDCETLLDALGRRGLLSHAYQESAALEAENLIKEAYHPVLLRLHDSLLSKARQ